MVALQESAQRKLFSSSGVGTVKFDVKRGLPISCDMKYEYVKVQAGRETKTPINFSYKLNK